MWLINWQSKFDFGPTDLIQEARLSNRKSATHIPINSSHTYSKLRLKMGRQHLHSQTGFLIDLIIPFIYNRLQSGKEVIE
jgi:hypothetical protein